MVKRRTRSRRRRHRGGDRQYRSILNLSPIAPSVESLVDATSMRVDANKQDGKYTTKVINECKSLSELDRLDDNQKKMCENFIFKENLKTFLDKSQENIEKIKKGLAVSQDMDSKRNAMQNLASAAGGGEITDQHLAAAGLLPQSEDATGGRRRRRRKSRKSRRRRTKKRRKSRKSRRRRTKKRRKSRRRR